MLHVSNLTRRYGSFLAVNNASFDIHKGEIVGLLGHNGAGKTTIMKMLSGYLEPDNGDISLDSVPLAESAKEAQKQLGYLPENLPVYPEMTVVDYLDYAAHMKGLSGSDKQTEIKRAIAATDLGEKILEPIYTLSRGFKQRVGVAQAILGRPKLLILDEPTNGLDPTQTEQMRALIKDIAKQATVILSTHIMQEVDAICDRVLILNRGELVVDAKLEELRKSNRVALKTSLSEKNLREALTHCEFVEIECIKEEDKGLYSYLITLNEAQNSAEESAKIAQVVFANGGQLYQLNNEKRDLETLFKEVNRNTDGITGKGGLSNAA